VASQSEVSVALGFVYVLLNALGRPSYMAALAACRTTCAARCWAERTSASVGWIGAAALARP
jgi:hypothetical protein